MSSERARELEERGIQAAKAGQKDQARQLLQHALRLDPTSDNAWLWLASVARDKRERLICLQKVLEINPENDMGLKAVQAMGIDPARIVPQRGSISDSLVTDEEAEEAIGVPVPEADALEAAFSLATEITEENLGPIPSTVEWVRKPRGRAGEREIVALRLQIASAVAVLMAAVIGIAVLAVNNSPELRVALFGASATPTPLPPSPTFTLTPRPDINPTATPQPDLTVVADFTPTPTVNPGVVNWPVDQLNTPVYQTPTPTQDPNNPQPEVAIATAASLLENGNDLPTAVSLVRDVQRQTANRFEPYAYYYEAQILQAQGLPEAALERLDVGQAFIDGVESENSVVSRDDIPSYQPVIDAGYGRVYLAQMEDAVAINNNSRAADLLELIEERYANAISFLPSYVEPYVIMNRAYRLVGDYDQALEVLDTAEASPADLLSDIAIITARGHTYMEQAAELDANGDTEGAQALYTAAQYQGFLGVFVNPFSEEAHTLRVEATLALDNPALASIYTNNYLFYQPSSVRALVLLAETRLAENKPDFALTLYSEALGLPASNAIRADLYLSRVGLYNSQFRYGEALRDLNAAFELRPDLPTQFMRMEAAYDAGQLDVALADAENLIEQGYVEIDQARFIKARVLVDQEQTDRYDEALDLLLTVTDSLPVDLRPIGYEYQSRIFYAQEQPEAALDAINTSLNAVETGSRHFLRAQIYEQLGQREDAINEYEWVITWDVVYSYPFAETAQTRRQALLDEIAQEQAEATATAATATQAVLDVTSTTIAEETATAAFLTQEAIGTFTPVPTPTAVPEATEEIRPEATADVVATPSPPPTPTAPSADDDPTPTREGG